MKNILQYYYDLEINNFKKTGERFIFFKDSIGYEFAPVDCSMEEIEELYQLSQQLNLIGLPCHNILLNKNYKIITIFNNKNYILLKKNVISNDLVTINDIVKFSNYTSFNWNYKNLNRTNWRKLWSDKIDYFEYQLSQLGNKMPLLCQLFGYYEGIVETGIQLLSLYNNISANICISHKRIDINTTLSDFYNPLNFIIDYKIRDAAEYFKNMIVTGKNEPIEMLYFLEKNTNNNNDVLLFFIRLFFPSFYFDIYEKILIDNMSLNLLDCIMICYINYEKNIKKIYSYIREYINLPKIDWLLV